MRVKVLSRVGDQEPLVKKAAVVIVEDKRGTPISVAVDIGNGLGYHVAHADDEDFNDVLHSLGIDRLTICEELPQTPPEKLSSLPLIS